MAKKNPTSTDDRAGQEERIDEEILNQADDEFVEDDDIDEEDETEEEDI